MAKRGTSRGRRSAPASVSAEHRAVILHGKEGFLRRVWTERYVDALREKFGDVDPVTVDGASAAAVDVLDELRTYSLLGGHKLVIVDEAEKFLKAGGESGTSTRQLMEKYLTDPAPDASLVLRSETWRPGKLDKLVEKCGTKIKCDELGQADAAHTLVQRAESQCGVPIEPAAASRLVERAGTELTRLISELHKLAAFVGTDSIITVQAVEALTPPSRDEQAWAIQSAIASGNPRRAMQLLEDLLDVARQPEELVYWSILDLLRKLHLASSMLREGAGAQTVMKEARLWGADGQRMLDVARRLEPGVLAQLLHHAVEADAARKSGRAESRRTLEVLTIETTDSVR